MRHPLTHASTVIIIAGAIALSACGSADDSPSTASATARPAVFNDADVFFAQSMISHHEQAVEMSIVALDPSVSASAEIQRLAAEIQEVQEPEIELLSTLLGEWGQPVDMPGSEGLDDMTGRAGMDGMMSNEDMTSLTKLTDREFNMVWPRMMIEHHRGALAQAAAALAEGSNPDIALLADQIISTQQAEIDEMTALIQD